MWLARFFGLTPDCAAVWASAGQDKPKEATEAATASSIAMRFILSSSLSTPARNRHELWGAAYYVRSRQLFRE
jgi:hypothetical protein